MVRRSTSTSTKRKQFAFKMMAILLSMFTLVAFEFILRISGYGTDYPLFVTPQGKPEYWVMNPEISKKYFVDQEHATTGYQELFKKEKDLDTFRIFVLGASTGVGYPYGHNGSFHRWLQYALNETYPENSIEIINVSLTAVNSFTLLDFTRQLVDYRPDAVLIYAGHNEYYGALGVGSVGAFGGNSWMVRLFLELKKYRLVQLLSDGIQQVKKWMQKDAYARETLMKKMVAVQEIPYGSKRYHQGVAQFNDNFTRILNVLDERAIPTFLSTVVSNEKDLKPFISDDTDTTKSAEHYFDLGAENLKSSHFSVAKEQFVKAKELDLLRFRAPDTMNIIIREMAKKYKNVHLVDTYQRFCQEAPNGILGKETLLEHVHPNLNGYSLLAHSFYTRMNEENTFNDVNRKQLSWAELKRQMPITRVDSIQGFYELMSLKGRMALF